MRTVLSLLVLGLATVAAPAFAEIYRYSDASGAEHFLMEIEEVPEAYRAQALERANEASQRFNVVGPNPRASQREPRAAVQKPASRSPQASSPRGSEKHWRNLFAAQHKALEKAERELQRLTELPLRHEPQQRQSLRL
jgi:hypothetical protein